MSHQNVPPAAADAPAQDESARTGPQDDPRNDTATGFPLATMRHSCAHVMAAAIQSIWPKARFGVGPAIDNGFFYDVMFDEPISDKDLPRIEQAMRKLRKGKKRFSRDDMPVDAALAAMDAAGQDYKVELLRLLKEKGSTAVARETGDADAVGVSDGASNGSGVDRVSFYKTGDFIDLCRGPHVDHAGQIGVFKLTRIAGAYWRGDQNNPQLQRIYGLCFDTQEALDHEIWRLEEAKKRDHRKLGKELELFTFTEEVGLGLPIWLPRGTVIRAELQRLALREERRDGYFQVVTPQITKEDLYYRSGHLPYYKDDMYAPMDIDGENFYLRPMNCPHHHQVYLSRKRSYRDLPLRIAEYGDVYRYEAHGGLSGLMRTRAFCQNDAHIYCRFDQAKAEFIKVMRLHARYYDLMGIKDYYMRFSLPDLDKLDKFVDAPDKWLEAMRIIREAMDESGYPYQEEQGEAAFYGPKVDFMIRSVIGTEYAISTNQLDFLATDRFELTYTGEDNEQHPVYVIHRAPLGSHERFTAFLIEHYAGAFPTWIAPVQIRVIPIADRHNAYAEQVVDFFRDADVETGTGGLRIDSDVSSQTMQKRIRQGQLEKIPYMLVVGDKEAEQQQVAVRLRSGADLGALSLDAVLERISDEVRNRRDLPGPASG